MPFENPFSVGAAGTGSTLTCIGRCFESVRKEVWGLGGKGRGGGHQSSLGRSFSINKL